MHKEGDGLVEDALFGRVALQAHLDATVSQLSDGIDSFMIAHE